MAKEDKVKVVQKVKNGALMSDGSIRISNVRFSYPHVVTPFVNENDEGVKTKRFKVQAMLGKKTHKEILEVIKERFAEILKENKVKAIPADKKFLSDGDESGKDEQEGFWLVSASEKTRPTLRKWEDDDKTSVLLDPEEEDDLDGLFYGGAWGSVWINPWWQDHKKYGKRINANLRSIMFKKHGEPFGQGRVSEEDTETAFDDDDDDDGEDEAPRRSSGKSSSSKKRYEEDEDPDDI